jgi:hypothetical protein
MAEPADRLEGAEEHEQEHLPGPSFWPVLLALGISMSLIGVITKLAVLIIGLLIALIALGGWIREARRDYRELS